jgi:hypothetical protein
LSSKHAIQLSSSKLFPSEFKVIETYSKEGTNYFRRSYFKTARYNPALSELYMHNITSSLW